MQVLCDTSFLMVLVEKPIKYIDRVEHEFGRLDFIVPGIVIDELKRLAEKAGPKRAMMAKTAIEIISAKFKEVQIPKAAHVDDAIVEYATENKCAVATIDTNLRRRLIANEILVLTLSRDRLVVANPNLE
jgi:rRNA-processing protein FCF1